MELCLEASAVSQRKSVLSSYEEDGFWLLHVFITRPNLHSTRFVRLRYLLFNNFTQVFEAYLPVHLCAQFTDI